MRDKNTFMATSNNAKKALDRIQNTIFSNDEKHSTN